MHTSNQAPTNPSELDPSTLAEMERISQKIHDAQQAMLAQDPQIKTYCAMIWKQFLACPELTHILPPETIGSYVRTLAQISAIEITKEKPKAKSKALKNVSVDDL